MLANTLLVLLVQCLNELPPSTTETRAFLLPERDVYVSVGYTSNNGWSVLMGSSQKAYACKIPDPIQACMSVSAGCQKFGLLMALPDEKKGLEVTFLGEDFKNAERLNRLAKSFAQLPPKSVNREGLVLKTVPAFQTPVVGLKCSSDQIGETTAQLRHALTYNTASLSDAQIPASCKNFFAKTAHGPVESAPEVPADASH